MSTNSKPIPPVPSSGEAAGYIVAQQLKYEIDIINAPRVVVTTGLSQIPLAGALAAGLADILWPQSDRNCPVFNPVVMRSCCFRSLPSSAHCTYPF